MPGGIHPQLNHAEASVINGSVNAAGTRQSKCAIRDACKCQMQMQLFKSLSGRLEKLRAVRVHRNHLGGTGVPQGTLLLNLKRGSYVFCSAGVTHCTNKTLYCA